MSGDGYVCVIDDDVNVGAVAAAVLEPQGFTVRCYNSPSDFLKEFDEQRTLCVVSDLYMPGETGWQLFQRLQEEGSQVSFVILTGRADVRSAVRMMEEGVLTLLEKPYEPHDLVAAVRRATTLTLDRRAQHHLQQEFTRRLASLSDDERAVLDLMITGLPNKAIASRLSISPRTLDRRRSTVLETMGVRTVSELAALVVRARPAKDEPGAPPS